MISEKEQLQLDINEFAILLQHLHRDIAKEKEPHFSNSLQSKAFEEVNHRYDFKRLKATFTENAEEEEIITKTAGIEEAKALFNEIDLWLENGSNGKSLLKAANAFNHFLDNQGKTIMESQSPVQKLNNDHIRYAVDVCKHASKLTEIINRWDQTTTNLQSKALKEVISEKLGLNEVDHDIETTQTTPEHE
ncbi:MAG: hypothetical protein ACRBDI_09920 [Alphaproteobacteria bacterium]